MKNETAILDSSNLVLISRVEMQNVMADAAASMIAQNIFPARFQIDRVSETHYQIDIFASQEKEWDETTVMTRELWNWWNDAPTADGLLRECMLVMTMLKSCFCAKH